MNDVPAILKENKRRLAAIHAPYDPISGAGSPIPRVLLSFAFNGSRYAWYIPKSMAALPAVKKLRLHKSIKVLLQKSGEDCGPDEERAFFQGLTDDRLRHDFEFWASTCAHIQDKTTKQIIKFVLRRPQLKLLLELERMRLTAQPIRIILLKARQWGGSTLIQLYMQWVQIFHRPRWHSVIATDVESQARTIRRMYTRVAKHHPSEIQTITLAPFEGDTKNREFVERETVISIGSMQKPDSLRSQDIMMAHLSEVGLWKETEGRKPEDLVQTIIGSVPDVPYTIVVKESTAKGVGNYFHTSWLSAVNGQSTDIPVFVAWHEIEICATPIDNYEDFITSMNAYECYLWSQGATLEGIHWYRRKLKEFNGDTWRMQSENPTTAIEAFQSTGRRVFAPDYVQRSRLWCSKPIFKGELFADARKGTESLNNISFKEIPEGNLWVWALPDTSINVVNRYALFADIGGRTAKADYSVIRVLDRYPMIEGGVPEVVATWRGHLDQDLFAWKCAQVAMFYNKGLLAIEVNSIRKDAPEGGEHHLTVLDEIGQVYDNLYHRSNPEDIAAKVPTKWGFHTNSATKTMIIDTLNAALRDEGYIERDERACNEMDCYEEKPDKSLGAVDGQKDDIVMSTAGAIWLATSSMPPPKEVKPRKPEDETSTYRVTSAAVI